MQADGLKSSLRLLLKSKSQIASFFQLMKPSIMLLVLVTGATALVLEGSLVRRIDLAHLLRFGLVLLGLLLTGGSANAFNMYLERDIDARMARTRNRRPLPLRTIKAPHALAFAIAIGVAGVTIFATFFNLLSAFLSLATILFYSFFYTLYLKPRTPYNIVIGGAAGSMAPVIAWAAVTGSIAMQPLFLFAIIFLWTPPHFWALALYTRKDYEIVQYPMMPIARGDDATKRQIFLYVLALVLFSTASAVLGAGLLYALVASMTGVVFIRKSLVIMRATDNNLARGLFGYSIIYLFAIFGSLMLDAALKIRP
jgi:protoheme IX farnesyltransferase